MLFMCWALYKSLRADAREEGVPEEGEPQEEEPTDRTEEAPAGQPARSE
ncbi:MAG: hypothetical protein M3N18_00375 [Actinomycetota bacterium]|nr:hypothetical protein [Actinomycetota bacterium]